MILGVRGPDYGRYEPPYRPRGETALVILGVLSAVAAICAVVFMAGLGVVRWMGLGV